MVHLRLRRFGLAIAPAGNRFDQRLALGRASRLRWRAAAFVGVVTRPNERRSLEVTVTVGRSSTKRNTRQSARRSLRRARSAGCRMVQVTVPTDRNDRACAYCACAMLGP